jgi:hypothetical protein
MVFKRRGRPIDLLTHQTRYSFGRFANPDLRLKIPSLPATASRPQIAPGVGLRNELILVRVEEHHRGRGVLLGVPVGQPPIGRIGIDVVW